MTSPDDAPPRRVLLRRGLIHTGDDTARHTALAWDGGRLVGSGDEAWAETYADADEVVDLAGAWVAPAFVDAHVHTVATGFLRTQLDLTSVTSLAACLDAVAAADSPETSASVLLGTGWDESSWPERRAPTADELERAAPGRPTYLNRVDGHSAVVSRVLAAAIPGLTALPGWHGDGLVEREAYAAVNRAVATLIGPEQRLEAARAAVADMARHGIAGFHENAAPHLGPASEMDLVRRAAQERGLHVTLYWGEIGAFDVLDRHGAVGLAGDLNADGAIGSCTAAVTQPYARVPEHAGPHGGDAHHGHGFVSVDQVRDHVAACTQAGVQAGFHCIGDAALEVVAEGFELAAERLGDGAVRAARHRLEHVEMPSHRVRRTLARLGVTASVQPVFDALWGGATGMYADRLGSRWREMNPFAAMHADGVPLAFGSDGPVTPMGAWAAVRAAVEHRTAGFGLTPAAAFAAHTVGGWRAARIDDAGHLAAGQRAHVAVWDVDPPSRATSAWLPAVSGVDMAAARCRTMWVDGSMVRNDQGA